jgi:hypothetical protein
VKKYKVSVYLDSGAIIVVDCDNFEVTRTSDGCIRSIKWEGVAIALFTIDINHVIAVTGLKNKE